MLLGLVAGFVVFARVVADYLPNAAPPRADGIVVLTGGDLRLRAGARLLEQGRGARLLISGVNPQTTRQDIRRLSRLSNRMFAASVDIDYAHTTIDNAEETKAWARAHGFNSLIVVTSSYHMPRSLTELGRAMPGVTLLPYPVVPHTINATRWWTDGFTTKVLLGEYAKFLTSAARYGADRMWRWGEVAAARSHAAGE